jgi:uncharacterized NAD-dependent epimerase/dehydratase family protein
MKPKIDGSAIVYCEGAFNTPNGKTAHGLVRFTRRYQVVGVIDSRYAGQDAGHVLDSLPVGIPVFGTIYNSVRMIRKSGTDLSHFVVGLAPDGGRLKTDARKDVTRALALGLNIDCGLHDYLSEDIELTSLAQMNGLQIRDIRKPPERRDLHFFTGKIEAVHCLKVAVLGTDSAVGKRTTAWKIVQGLEEMNIRAEMIGTGQTAWMQGAKYCLIMDSLINDFVSGEIEHAVWSAWNQENPDVIVIEGQGSLMNPAYPGGFEILAAGRPDIVVLQHAPARREYDGFPGYPIQPLTRQIQAVELLSGKPVVAVTLNHENLMADQVPHICDAIEKTIGLPAFDVLLNGSEGLVNHLCKYLNKE